MPKYLDPKNDLTFKRIFADHPHLLVDFLNAVMPFEEDRFIVTLEYLPGEMPPQRRKDKFSIVDVRCKDNFGRQFIVEMQMFWDKGFYNRLIFNAGKAYMRQLAIGEKYHLLQPVYTLALVNENFDLKTDKFYHHFQIVNRENTDEIMPGLEFVMIELTDKFNPEIYAEQGRSTVTDRKLMILWLRFMKEVNENLRKLPDEMSQNEHISEAAKLCEIGAFTPEELAEYDKIWDIIRTEKTLLDGRFADGLQKGRAESEEIIKEKDKTIEQKDKAIEQYAKELEELKRQLKHNSQ